MTDILVKALASQMLAYRTGNDMRVILRRALQSDAGRNFRGGREGLLYNLHARLSSMLAEQTDEEDRLRLIAAICAVQVEYGTKERRVPAESPGVNRIRNYSSASRQQ